MAQSPTAIQALQYVPLSGDRRHHSKQRFFVVDLSQALFDFVIQLLPTAEEMTVKEDVRKLLERLIRTIEPDSRLLSFGSTANGFSLRNSDMDLCCLIDSEERLSASDLVTMLGDLLERETKFHVKPLPHARIPIVKLSLDPSPGLPLGIACDIGFENRLALENTRLLMCYAMIDPTRVRTLVLFLKVWSKRRKINSPYQGTLSSYGYVLLVIYFLIHVKNPPVLPNLQQMPPLRPISQEDTHMGDYNTWFFDDIELLRQRWQSSNTDSVAELLVDFFRYYSRDFSYNNGVASIRAGLLKKDSKGWQNDLSNGRYNDARERNRFCVEDPFETDFNVARCVTKEGLYKIRGEFMRASRILALRPRAIVALSQLCEERIEDVQSSPPPSIFIPPRLSFPPQAPYTVGSSSMRPKNTPTPEQLSHSEFPEPKNRSSDEQCVPSRSPPEHMAPKRSQWTSPPPPEAPPAQHALFEDQLGQSLARATSSSIIRDDDSSGDNLEVPSDEERRSDAAESDDVRSVRSYTETSHFGSLDPSSTYGPNEDINPGYRGRVPSRPSHPIRNPADQGTPSVDATMKAYRAELLRRSHSGPPSRKANRFSWPSTTPLVYPVGLLPSPSRRPIHLPHPDPSIVFYETTAQSRISHAICPTNESNQSHSSSSAPFHLQTYMDGIGSVPRVERDPATTHLSESLKLDQNGDPLTSPASILPSPSYMPYSHSHSPSTATITASTSPSAAHVARRQLTPSNSRSRSPSQSPLRSNKSGTGVTMGGITSSPISIFCGSDSSTPSSTSCATSLSPSPSPTPPHLQDELPITYLSPHLPMKLTQQRGIKPHLRSTRVLPVESGAAVDLTHNVPSLR
ncbi:hypothetical protein BJ138DRAFT_1160301 [Hygrophoropsis aurantiaca]|uniref:Uncharacterized protein n=1 Tax=Hygrophoropsis aurantiaca TaxID=72124 RepID=A0ACB8A212_9AGAM|nr:hypothetical protein BJ138DRAFT_1160301 [Hygrophoropsis aurantiaca]